jgi:hypothetical protein
MSDNIFTFKRALRPFLEYMQSGKNGFVSTTLKISDGFEFSVSNHLALASSIASR